MNQPFRILMVEDMQHQHKLSAADIREVMGATVDLCTSGEDVLAKLQDDPSYYDLLLLGLALPGLSGQEVLSRLRANSDFDNIPIIILTGSSDPIVQSELFANGADEFIEKDSASEVFIARLKAQAKHKLALDRLTQLAVDREAFAAGVLHDIRNIEMNLLASCELIEMQLRSDCEKNMPQILKDLASFKEQIQRIDVYASSVIKKVREGANKLRVEPVDMPEIIEWAKKFVTGNQSELNIDLREVKEWKPVQADRHLLQVAVLNIIQNSIKYARPEEAPHIKVSQNQVGECIQTRFRDNGIGLPKSELRKIFEPFYRAHTRKDAKSQGLGLSMTGNVIGKMSGKVWAELPEDGQPGTSFVIELPSASS